VPWDAPGSTAVVVLTPEAEPITGAWYRAHSKAGSEGMRPHITLLVPFVPASELDAGVEDRLQRVLSATAPFDYALERVERWPEGIVYLAPEPARPFVDLIQALTAEFPHLLRYDGRHDSVIPHATVAVSEDAELLARVTAEVHPHLPIACRTAEATIVERGADLMWRVRTSLPLGSLGT
jgi:2'-5' RNA ligase